MSQTLRVYLQKRFRQVETAKILHIHRSTLLYRLERISEITGLKITEIESELHIHITYEMMDRIKEKSE